jgi:Tol biopolymer transport system component
MTNLPKRAAFGSFSPDGSQIAFRRTGFDGDPITEMTVGNLYLANSDGSDFERVGPEADSRSQIDGGALWPMWSPNGTRIVYERLYGNGVFVYDVHTGESRHVTPDGTRPTWLDSNTLIIEAMR